MSTKEQIAAALKKAFRRKEVKIAEGVTVSIRELSRKEHDALNARLFKTEPDGTLSQDKDGYLVPREDGRLLEEWLAATMEPAYTVEELLSDEWPASVKAMLYREARAVNTVSLEEAAKNS